MTACVSDCLCVCAYVCKAQQRENNARRYERTLTQRLSLQAHWLRAAATKHARDQQQRALDRAPCAGLVHEQCDRYARCGQCKRRLNNTGTSNVLPGTLSMV